MPCARDGVPSLPAYLVSALAKPVVPNPLGSVSALADPQLAPGCPVPEGFLAALTLPVASATVEGAVGLWAQAARIASVESRTNGFIKTPAEDVNRRAAWTAGLAVNARAGEAHLKGHRRNRHSAIRPMHACIHREQPVAAARDGRYTLTRVAPPRPTD